MSTLGIIHTVIGVMAVIAGMRAFYKYGLISNKNWPGHIYIVGTLIAGMTAFGLSKTGKLNEAHVLTVFTLIALAAGVYLKNDLVKAVSFSLSFFLSLIPATVETLTRLPVGDPIAANQEAPIVQGLIGFWFVLFLIGVSYQIYQMKREKAYL